MLLRNQQAKRVIYVAGFLLLCGSSRTLAAAAGPGAALAEPAVVIGDPSDRGASTEWRSVRSNSLLFLSIQHSTRVAFQQKTRQYLGGHFLSNYGDSVKGLHGWGDGDSIFTNYVLHPMQGASTGFFYIQANPRAEEQQFGRSGDYWKSRLKAMGIAALYSTQFELGPISEASIGNVGMKRGTMGFVDLVITPVGGFGWMLAEDAIDRFVIEKLERKWRRPGLMRFLRVALNPTRSVANVMRFRLPWYRPGRPASRLYGPPRVVRKGPKAGLMLVTSGGACMEDSAVYFQRANDVLNPGSYKLSPLGTMAAAAE